MLSDADLKAIRERAEMATPGPWYEGQRSQHGGVCPYIQRGLEGGFKVRGRSPDQEDADAAFIAAARTDVPRLLDEVERLRKENARLRGGFTDYLLSGLTR